MKVRSVSQTDARQAALLLADHFGIDVDEMLDDMKVGRLVRNANAAELPKPAMRSRAETYWKRARCGDRVYLNEGSPRNIGTIKSMIGTTPRFPESHVATIIWDNGWISENIKVINLRRAK